MQIPLGNLTRLPGVTAQSVEEEEEEDDGGRWLERNSNFWKEANFKWRVFGNLGGCEFIFSAVDSVRGFDVQRILSWWTGVIIGVMRNSYFLKLIIINIRIIRKLKIKSSIM